MKTKFNGILTLLLAFVVQISFAQTKTITGTVSDASGSLPGVSVVIKGTTTGTETDFDGKYSISAKPGDVLQFRYLGYKTAERTVGTSNTISVTLTEDSNVLEEIVVVGYGTTTQKAFTGTASVVKQEQIEAKNFSNVSQALIGEVAGVTVINPSGQPGTVGAIRIRGFGSVNGNRAPLYVVDGVPFEGGLNSINPADIAAVTILKDATATAIYGSRGANGVVVITTKKGSAANTYIEVDVKSSVNAQLIPRYDVIRNPETYVGLVWEGIYNGLVDGGNPNPVQEANNRLFTGNGIGVGYNMWNVQTADQLIDPATRMVRPGVTRRYTPELYLDNALSPSTRIETNLRMGGGSENSNYFASIGYLEDNGIAINTDFKRVSSRINLNADIKPWLKVGFNVGYAFTRSTNNGQTNGAENLFEFADKMAPIYPVFERDANGDKIPDQVLGGFLYDYGFNRPNSNSLNPIASALYDLNRSDRHELNGNINFEIKFTDYLSLQLRYGAQYFTNEFKSFTNPFYGPLASDGGRLSVSTTVDFTQNLQQILRFSKDWGGHSLEVLAAHESFEYDRDNVFQAARNMASPFILELSNFIEMTSTPSGSTAGYSIESVFSQANYNFDQKYFFSASVRADGSSRFVNDKWGTFGSVGASWVLTSEDFLKDNNTIKFLKLKASYGVNGDQNGVGFFSGFDTFNINNLAGNVSISPAGNGNPDITWETSRQLQVGAEFTLGSFLDGSLDAYQKTTDNLIFQRRVGPSQGIAIITVNDGELVNRGLEFDLTAHLIKKQDFTLDLSLNGNFLDNEITRMPLDPATGEPRYIDTSNAPYGWAQGRSIFDFYVREYAGVNPANGKPLWYQYWDDRNDNGVLDPGEPTSAGATQWFIADPANPADTDGLNQSGSIVEYQAEVPDANLKRQVTETYDEATEKYVNKRGIPLVSGAFRLAANIGNFDFSSQFTYSLGGYAYDGQYAELLRDALGAASNNFSTDILDRWQRPGDITNVPRLSDGADPRKTSASTNFITSTDFIALNNLRVGYTVPQRFISQTGIQTMNVFFSGDNIFMESARNGFFPTASETGNTGRGFYAPVTTLTLGVRVRF